MPTNSFFPQPVSPSPSPAIQSGKPGPSNLNQSSGTSSAAKSAEGDTENFLTMLKKVSHHRTSTKLPRDNDEALSSDCAVAAVGGEIDETTGPTSTAGMTTHNEQDTEPVQLPSDWNFAAFIKVLEGMGLHDAIGESGSQELAEVNPLEGNQLAALEVLMARLQQDQSSPTADLQEGLQRLRQFITNARDGQVLIPIDSAFRQGLSSNQMTELDLINQWLRGSPPGMQEQKENSDLLVGKGSTDAKLAGTMPSETGVVARAAENSAVRSPLENPNPANLKSSGTMPSETGVVAQTAENTAARSSLENPNPADLKSSGTMPAATGVVAQATENTAARSQLENPSPADLKPSGTMPSETGVVAQAAENSGARSQLENQGPVDPNLSSDTRPLVSQNNQDSHPKAAADSENADPSKAKVALEFLGETRNRKPAETVNRMGPVPGHDQPNTTATAPDSQSQKPNPSSGMNPSVAKFSESFIQSTAGEEPLSKVFQEAQLAKEGVVRVESGSLEETVSKVIKTEAGTSDNGLLNSSGQNPEKLAELASIKKDAETSQSELRNQTLDQIVRKAAIHLRNGQHEARIELKPDFLGHIRMQIISDNQQVTVKILAQHGFVKDMIESNVHQLKADLQQQGLEVDKLEVTVSRDPDDSANYKDKLAQSKFRHGSANRNGEDRPTEEQPQKPRHSPLVENGSSTVDYFA